MSCRDAQLEACREVCRQAGFRRLGDLDGERNYLYSRVVANRSLQLVGFAGGPISLMCYSCCYLVLTFKESAAAGSWGWLHSSA